MTQKKARKKLFTAITVVAALLLVVAVIAIVQSASQPEPASPADTTKKDTPAIVNNKTDSTTEPTVTEEPAVAEPAVDPAQTSSLDIEPMSIIVSYMKGVPGFDFEVLRSASGTKYVQLSAAKLVGTKCTDDKGQFASIIEKPSADEATTLAKMVTVEGTEYGLSLAGTTCTSNTELLTQYQDAISGAFSLLKKM